MNKNIIIILLLIVSLGLGGYIIFRPVNDAHNHSAQNEEKQLYTCGMHPDVISEEPGDCPICGMRLMPMKKNSKKTKASGERKIAFWRAPMNPSEIYDKPGKSRMGMDLVPVYEDEQGGEGIVKIDPVIQQNINVKIQKVEVRDLRSEILTNGVLTTDETKEFIVNTKVSGWVQKLYVNYTGQKVKKGEKLFDIYSPQLVAAEQELLTAVDYKKNVSNTSNSDILGSGDELLKHSIKKLELLDVTKDEIKKIIETGELKTYITLYSPINGTVIHKNIVEGAKISAGTPIVKIADLSNLWLTADIYEYELSKINVGSEAEIRFNFLPSKVFNKKISFIYPTLNGKTRTAKIRFNLSNLKDELKPDMYASVKIKSKILSGLPVVPEEAIIRSGKKNIMIQALGEGRFKAVEVQLGEYADGYYQVAKGISEGNMIVYSAQFLIDSESSLKSAIKQFDSPETDEEIENSDSSNTMKMEGMEMNSNSSDNEMKMNHENNEMANMVETKGNKEEKAHSHDEHESLVRKGIINLDSIDKNGDGKVYQDMMDWNVISDEPGRCPLCNMKLKELTKEEVKENLIKNGFQVK